MGGYTRPTNNLSREREGGGSDTTASFGFVTPQGMKPGSSVEVSTSGTRVYKKKNNAKNLYKNKKEKEMDLRVASLPP